MMLVDSHCHLNFPEFRDDLDGIIARARAAGVKVMQTICTEMAEFDEVHGIAQKYDGVYCSVGVHPNDSGDEKQVTAQELIDKCHHPKVIGIGETGLDFHYETASRQLQEQNFREHIHAGRVCGLPVIVHSRDADTDTIRVLADEMKKGAFKFLIHCFTGTKELADESVKMGGYISLSGIISFKNSGAIREALSDVPLDRLLVETDAPFLAPVPYRGKRNEPSYTIYTNRILAELKSLQEHEMAALTTENFFRLFSKAKKSTTDLST
ncbi:MAG: TatD family hydrolase [Rickettsiales bacterium]|jgi:TatD DNase family protein|nr:TatD family hydrolase [Rickettsiales bacterium]